MKKKHENKQPKTKRAVYEKPGIVDEDQFETCSLACSMAVGVCNPRSGPVSTS
ncbi:MAG: hypothetical protein GY854_12555 [Deltaproteobacteria bacterium]|nr:hypothetical protein [Deltaproteobacteria bacterium]